MKEIVKISHAGDVLLATEKWKRRREENFLTVTLGGGHNIIKVHHVTKGLLNQTIVHPRESFYPAVKDYAAAVIFVHNHPGGNENPSGEDDLVTNRLCMAGIILGIQVLDHIIITPSDKYYSYKRYGKINGDYSASELEKFINSLPRRPS